VNVASRYEGPAELNVFGEALQPCSSNPLTGFFRTGYCAAGPDGAAQHLICIEASEEFLAYSQSVGNDLMTPMPAYSFPGLKAGDRWCLVAMRWKQAHEAGKAPRVHLRATNQAVLELIPFETLRAYARDLN
jgi:uncharacterized protein (DUF2237 family)